jgi:DNA-binding NtrC family response regulator
MRRLTAQARLASRLPTPVLLVGEPGTGKHTVARVIHYQGPNRESTFVALDCTRLPAPAVAAVLFGGRDASPPAPVGAVYLREPAALPRELQLRLAQWLADVPAGPEAAPRILAGSRATLAEAMATGRMLEELACALGTLVLEVPPLRERADDLPALVERLLGGWVVGWLVGSGHPTNQPTNQAPNHLTGPAWEVIRAARWPGNLHQLAAVLAAAAGRAEGGRIDVHHLPAPLRLAVSAERTPAPAPPRPLPLAELLEQAERRLIELALRRAHGNKTRAAELLAVWRPRLQRRMDALHITRTSEGLRTED